MSTPGPGSQAAARILLVDRDMASGSAMAQSLAGCLALAPVIADARSGRGAAELLRAERFDMLLVELSAIADLAAEAEEAVARLVRLSAGALVVALSDGASVSATVAAMRAGAHDYIVRPLSPEALGARIGELAQRHGKAALLPVAPRRRETPGYAGFIGGSHQMQAVYEQIERVAPAASPVFITGERGTGKDLCAEALHERGPRSRHRLVSVDCAAMPRDAMEAELFGAAPGSSSQQAEGRKGAVELADGGTLFLDEIGELDLSLQGKLLRLLQTGTTSRLGESGERRVDVRVICATRRNPMQLIAERRFREDLFYRLHVLPIHLPPLRQRPPDIPALAAHFLERFAGEEHKRFSGLAPEAVAVLVGREWPGNVTQLMTLMRRVVVMFEGGEVGPEMLAAADFEDGEAAFAATPRRPSVLPMWRQEQRIIEEAIESFGGNISLAAAALELSPSTIYRKRQAWAEMDGKKGAA